MTTVNGKSRSLDTSCRTKAGDCVMFMGEYNHTVDPKGRLIVPAKFREQLGDEFVVTKGLGWMPVCVYVRRMAQHRGEVPETFP